MLAPIWRAKLSLAPIDALIQVKASVVPGFVGTT